MVFDLSVLLETGIPFCIPKPGKYGQFLVKKPLEPLFALCSNRGIYGVSGRVQGLKQPRSRFFSLKKNSHPFHFFKEKPGKLLGQVLLPDPPPENEAETKSFEKIPNNNTYPTTAVLLNYSFAIAINFMTVSSACSPGASVRSNHMII